MIPPEYVGNFYGINGNEENQPNSHRSRDTPTEPVSAKIPDGVEKTVDTSYEGVLSGFVEVFQKKKFKAGKTDCLSLSSYSKSRISSSLCPICATRQFDRHALFRDRSRMMVQRTPHLSASESAMIHLLFSLRHQGKGPCSSFCMSLRLTS